MTVRGTVAGLFVKPRAEGERGLPKRPAERIEIGPMGVAGDHNVWRAGRPDGDPGGAVLLFPEEELAALRAEGWPLGPGSLGENVLTRGLPYEATPPGTRVAVGSAELVVDRPCQPCRNLHLVVGEDRIVPFLRRMVDRRGWYARVERPGGVAVGDAVVVLDGASQRKDVGAR